MTEVDNDAQHAEVFFLDYGFTDVVSFNAMYEIPSTFSDLPPQAKECILAKMYPFF